jgi:hypothetical protein
MLKGQRRRDARFLRFPVLENTDFDGTYYYAFLTIENIKS